MVDPPIDACYVPRGRSPGRAVAVWKSPAFGLLGIGFYLATSIVVMAVIGNALDRRFDSEPVLTLIFLVLGLLLGFYGAYVRLREVMRRSVRPPSERDGR
ncbi:MAG: AtpZ/AtpI family protein [Chloroflexi bacterium]|nr:AtpZ/AtpI family protein [Chloroflexota bacterium]